MIITLDGYQGSGKTTQERALSKQLQIPVLSNWLKLVKTQHTLLTLAKLEPSPFSRLLGALSILESYPERNGIIRESFWTRLIGFSDSRVDGAIDLFARALAYGGFDNQIISFFLDLPRTQADMRLYDRFVRSSSIPINSIEFDKGKADVDASYRTFWGRIMKQVDWVHRIDAQLPAEQITSQIVSIVEGRV